MISSCSLSESTFNQAVRDTYEQCEDKNQCFIDFKVAVNKDWDTMYIFSEAQGNAALDIFLDFKYEKHKGHNRLILFVKNKKVVYEQSDVWGFSDESNPNIYFEKESYPRGINNEDASFQIKKSQDGVYTLRKIS